MTGEREGAYAARDAGRLRRWWRRQRGLLGWGLTAAASAFAAVAAGLEGAGQRLSGAQYLWMALAALVPGGVAYEKARRDAAAEHASRQSMKGLEFQLVTARTLIEQLELRLAQREQEEKERTAYLEGQRADLATVMGELGTTLAAVVSAAADQTRPEGERREQAGRYVRLVLETLRSVLGDDEHGRRGPLRVLLLQHHGDRTRARGETVTDSSGRRVAFSTRWAVGHSNNVEWSLSEGHPDVESAEGIMLHRSPWTSGTHIVDDVDDPRYSEGLLVLRPPDRGVESYARVAVVDDHARHGILCVDSWAKHALTNSDGAALRSFAKLLAVGLTIARLLGADPGRYPVDGNHQAAAHGPVLPRAEDR